MSKSNLIIETYSGQSFCGSELDVSKVETDLSLYEYLVEEMKDNGYEGDEIVSKLDGTDLRESLYGFQEVGEFDEEGCCEHEQGVTTYVWIEGGGS